MSDPATTLTVALVQMAVTPGAVEHNVHTASVAIAKAARQGADLVLLPELWACGYAPEAWATCASRLDAGVFARMATLAQEHSVALGGSHLEQDGNQYYNTFALYSPRKQRWGAYRKIHRFLPMGEDALGAGDAIRIAKTPWGKMGLAVCYDLRFPEMFRLQAVAGARLLLVVAEWPLSRIAHWNVLLRARAIENQAFVAAVNSAGVSGKTVFGGHSAVVSPRGEVLAQADENEALVTVSIDLAQADAYRAAFPALQHRQPQAYHLNEVENAALDT